jgi:hypothetical protein
LSSVGERKCGGGSCVLVANGEEALRGGDRDIGREREIRNVGFTQTQRKRSRRSEEDGENWLQTRIVVISDSPDTPNIGSGRPFFLFMLPCARAREAVDGGAGGSLIWIPWINTSLSLLTSCPWIFCPIRSRQRSPNAMPSSAVRRKRRSLFRSASFMPRLADSASMRACVEATFCVWEAALSWPSSPTIEASRLISESLEAFSDW